MNRRLKVVLSGAVLVPVLAGLSQLQLTPSVHANPAAPVAAAVAARAAPDFTVLVDKQGPAVVNITVKREDGQGAAEAPIPFYFGPNPPFGPPGPQGPQGTPRAAQGSGFVIQPDGYVLTNAHVVQGASEVTVKFTDKREIKAKVIGTDPRTDVALLKIEATDLPAVTIGDPSKVKVGEWVAAIGSPFGFENTISAGIVSAKGRALPDETYVPFIQTDVAVNPGNSGGPLFNLDGEVIGMNSQIYSRTGGYMGLSFAIPIDIAMDVASQLKQEGKVTRGRIGVQIQGLSQELAKSFGLNESKGALVSSVEKGSPADQAGMRSGDVILEFNGRAVAESSELPLIVGVVKPGTDATMKVWRDGKAQTLTVKVGELKPEKVAVAAAAPDAGGKLGLSVQDLTPEQRAQLDVKGGVVVGAAKGPAAKAGIQPGDVVLAINGEQVESATQFAKLVDQAPEGRPLALLIQRGDSRLYVPVVAS